MTKTREESLVKLSRDDIQVLDDDLLVLKGHRFYRPYITAAAINDDTILQDGDLGSIMVAQETARNYSRSTGLPAIEEEVFVVLDDAKEVWDILKNWLKSSPVQVIETRIPNANFTSLFRR